MFSFILNYRPIDLLKLREAKHVCSVNIQASLVGPNMITVDVSLIINQNIYNYTIYDTYQIIKEKYLYP